MLHVHDFGYEMLGVGFSNSALIVCGLVICEWVESGSCGGMFNGGNKFSCEFVFLEAFSPIEGDGRFFRSLSLEDWSISLNVH